ncbi:hypothetical protein OQJ26_10455 [Legionella sp. PATHC038]|nr:hypothetical protein [Legionella sp. PATHC038]MCW8399212.1 hypothetical protein [Legionella sp. PATHC038]
MNGVYKIQQMGVVFDWCKNKHHDSLSEAGVTHGVLNPWSHVLKKKSS